jgi:hypothetical protein
MKKIEIFIFFFLNVVYCLNAYKTIDLCLANPECNKVISFKCNEKYCGKDFQTCESFKYLNFNLNIRIFDLSKIFMHKNHKTPSLQPCLYNRNNRIEWQPSYVCFKEKTCLNKKYNRLFRPKSNNNNNKMHKTNCQCNEKHTIKCENLNYCGKDKEACDNLMINNSIQKCILNI